MREILFRGKRVRDGEWKYGYYATVVLNGKLYSAIDTVFNNRFVTPTTVYPETVGQYTGLTDKNGKRIFEGDIVRLYDTWGEWRAVVEFGNPNGISIWGWQLKPISRTDANTDILCWVEVEEAGAFCEVIGTIYDNPELLEVER